MNKNVGSMLFLYTETSLHAGSGTALGAVDLPIQRERMSGLPMVQGSGIKGALREQLRPPRSPKGGARDPAAEHLWLTLFGHEPPRKEDPTRPSDEKEGTAAEKDMFAGALAVTDARLLLFPLRTVVGGWAWATCPMVLQRVLRDLDTVGITPPSFGTTAPAWMTTPPADGNVVTGMRCTVLAGGSFLVEDFEMAASPDAAVDDLATWLQEHALPERPENDKPDPYAAFRKRVPGQLVVLGDTDFRFLTEHATEVVTRIRIGDTGTVEKGALWSEEALPAETLLYSLTLFADGRRPKPRKENGKEVARPAAEQERKEYRADDLRRELGTVLQKTTRICLGGDRTTGRGLVAMRVTKGGA